MQIDKLSKAVREKYGEEAAKTLREDWSFEDEEKFQKEIELLAEKEKKVEECKNYNLFNGEEKCIYCSKLKIYFKIKDDVSMIKYGCCDTCYINFIEGREERWNSGWRPNNKEK